MEFSGKLGENTLFLCEQVHVIALPRQNSKKEASIVPNLPLVNCAYQTLYMLCIALKHDVFAVGEFLI